MQQGKTNTKVAGVDVGKAQLDGAVHGLGEQVRFANTAEGIGMMVSWLQSQGVGRVGLEATAGYEQALRTALEDAGFEVLVHQPIEVRLFARLKRLKAKNDKIDAALIAAATAQVDTVKAAQDRRLRELAERMSVYEHVSDQLAQAKVFLEHVTLKDMLAQLKAMIARMKALKLRLLHEIVGKIRSFPDLAQRLELLRSLPGVGPINAASLLIRMPELGQMKRGQAAALLGVAPFDRDSGQHKGQRSIAGGRKRPRRLLYMAALTASRTSAFKAFADNLAKRGKPTKLIITAVMRKLIEAANLVLARGQPWTARA